MEREIEMKIKKTLSNLSVCKDTLIYLSENAQNVNDCSG